MQYSTTAILASLLSFALALPQTFESADKSVRVTLAGADELATQTPFTAVQLGLREVQRPVGSAGPFQTVNLEVGKGVPNQDLRCQILNEEGKPIVVLRDPNVDTTFSDKDGGEWKLQQESLVSAIICDPTFVAGKADTDITVILSGANELAVQTEFLLAGLEREVLPPVASTGPFDTVELVVGANVQQQGLRCQIQDPQGNAIILKRGQAIDTTFADNDGGAWTFLNPLESEVVTIICDPVFVANPLDLDLDITVILSGPSELATQTPFLLAGLEIETLPPVASSGPFNTVELVVGADVPQQGLRCQILDFNGKAITLKRGQAIDTTFADNDGGAWAFLDPVESNIETIVCNPAFVAAPAA